jgi:single-strand DNA-binding protein
MSNLNKVMLMGRLGSDPEIRTLDSGSVIASVNLATSESYTDKSGTKQESTEWHRLDFFDPLSKIVQKYCKKGDLLFVEGKIKTESWTDKDGNQKKTTKIKVSNLQLMPKGGGDGGGHSEPTTKKETTTTVQKPQVMQPTDNEGDDDLPF